MNDTGPIIEALPAELRQWLERQAQEHSRSLAQEIVCLIEDARARWAPPRTGKRDYAEIARIVKEMQALPVLDPRPHEEILYDEFGMPK